LARFRPCPAEPGRLRRESAMPRMKPRPVGLRPYAKTLSLAGLARRWGAPRRAVRRLAASGCLPFVEVAGHIRVAKREMRRMPNPFAG
jgi:hypothetical protein